jgi:hypothetical protein
VSQKNEDFLSFEKALRELKMRSEELKKLVSEGEIRAFRDGDSMKFRKEDIDAISEKAKGEDELTFADSLEDDTGMVTEQLSADDTLLAEEEDVVEDKPKRGARAGRAVPVAVVGPKKDPAWLLVCSGLGFLIAVWGFFICFSAAKESNPASGPLTSMFAPKVQK